MRMRPAGAPASAADAALTWRGFAHANARARSCDRGRYPYDSSLPQSHMLAALAEAEAAGARGEVPVGAVVVARRPRAGRAGNRTRELADPTAHAEMLAIRAGLRRARLGAARRTPIST